MKQIEGKRREETEKKTKGRETKNEKERGEKDTEQEKVNSSDMNMRKNRGTEKGERDAVIKNTLDTKKKNTEEIEKIERREEGIKKVMWHTQVTLEKLNSITRSRKSQRIISTASKMGIGKRPGSGKREISGVKKGTKRLQNPRGVTESGNIKIHQDMT